jgi:hypothetical protein
MGFHCRQEQGLLFRAVTVGQNYAKVGSIEITLTGTYRYLYRYRYRYGSQPDFFFNSG